MTDAKSATSPDGHTTVFVHDDPSVEDETVFGPTGHQDLCIRREGQPSRVLLRGRGLPKGGGAEKTLVGFDHFVFSPDGTTLYFTSDAWVTSEAAHAVDLRTGMERFIKDGAIVRTIEKGPYAGSLLLSHYRIVWKDVDGSTESGGRQPGASIISPSGKTLKTMVGETVNDRWTGEAP
jgi:hypothetical protein